MSIVISGVAKAFGDQQLFSDINFTIRTGQKVALIGRNGSGKSTLLRIIAGVEQADSGTCTVSGRVALLAQQTKAGAGTILNNVMPTELRDAEGRLQLTQEQLSDATPASLEAYATAEERFRSLGGYDFGTKAATVLTGLGLEPDRDMLNLSGGEQRRVMFARLLLSPAGTLLLDEPTNHLDVRSREWLEQWLRTSPATVVFVSHDRAFLDNAARRVLELERQHINDWPGNYSHAMELKATSDAATMRAYQAQERKKRGLESEMQTLGSRARSADRFNRKRASGQPLILAKAKAEDVSRTLAGRHKVLEKRLERMDGVERPFEDTLTITVPLPDIKAGPDEVFTAKNLIVHRAGLTLLGPINLHVRRGQKIAVTGPNGSGKSSLLLSLTGHLPHGGTVSVGRGLSVFEAWQHGEELTAFTTIGEAVRAAQEQLRDQDIFHMLGQLNLPASLDFNVADLSGGQRTKLALARLAVTRAHLLVLDEPTNNLDLEAISALEDLLVAYPGTILFASHDRRLVERVATAIWVCDEKDVRLQVVT